MSDEVDGASDDDLDRGPLAADVARLLNRRRYLWGLVAVLFVVVVVGGVVSFSDGNQPQAVPSVSPPPSGWMVLPDPPRPGALGPAVTLDDGRIVFVDSYGDPSTSLMGASLVYDPARGSWSDLPAPPAKIYNNDPMVWDGHEIILFDTTPVAGQPMPPIPYARSGVGVDSVVTAYALDPVAATWRTMSTSPPWALFGHRALWTGSEVLLLSTGHTFLGFHPSTDTWDAIPHAITKPANVVVDLQSSVLWKASDGHATGHPHTQLQLVVPVADDGPGSAFWLIDVDPATGRLGAHTRIETVCRRNFLGAHNLSVGQVNARSWGGSSLMGPQLSMTRARAASGVWNP